MREQVFFLLNYGNGYTDVGVHQMSFTARQWHVRRLMKKLKDEQQQRQQQQQQAKSQAASARSRARVPKRR